MVYLDYASTTPVRKEVLDTYTMLLAKYYGNSDSLHDVGRESAKLMEQSRASIAQLFNVRADEVYFTSCASESNNYAIKGYAWKNQYKGKHIITTCVEHSSIHMACDQLKEVFGFDITYLPINEKGVVELKDLQNALRKDTILVSMMMVNNETGAINPIKECADFVHEHSRAAFHMDGVQALGKVSLDLSWVDMATFSAHKIYGLKGSAIFYKRRNIEVMPLISGGQQENGYRAGTSNAPVNIVLAKTIRLIFEEQKKNDAYVRDLNDCLREALQKMDEFVINSTMECSPYIMNVSCLSIGSEVMLNALNEKGFAVSAQSTCSSKSKSISHVVLAMGLGELRATHAVRISLSPLTTKNEITLFIKALKEICHDYQTK